MWVVAQLLVHPASLPGKQESMMGAGVCRARQSRCPYYTRLPRVPGGLSGCTNHHVAATTHREEAPFDP